MQLAQRAQHNVIVPFFRLPAELRNRIYREALLSPEPVREGQEPALLQISQQIRHEASGIWYGENQFIFTIWHCRATHLRAFTARLRAADIARPRVSIATREPDWQGLLKWCRSVWADELLSLGEEAPSSLYGHAVVIAKAHAIAREYRDAGRSWAECEEALEAYRVAERARARAAGWWHDLSSDWLR
jgi:hypothetical protein